MKTRPASGCSKPATIRSSVVFPQPDGPSRVRNSPASTSSETSLTTGVPPNDFRTPSSETAPCIGSLDLREKGPDSIPRRAALRPRAASALFVLLAVEAEDHGRPGFGRERHPDPPVVERDLLEWDRGRVLGRVVEARDDDVVELVGEEGNGRAGAEDVDGGRGQVLAERAGHEQPGRVDVDALFDLDIVE